MKIRDFVMDFDSRWDISEKRKCLIYVTNVSHLVVDVYLMKHNNFVVSYRNQTLFPFTLTLRPFILLIWGQKCVRHSSSVDKQQNVDDENIFYILRIVRFIYISKKALIWSIKNAH